MVELRPKSCISSSLFQALQGQNSNSPHSRLIGYRNRSTRPLPTWFRRIFSVTKGCTRMIAFTEVYEKGRKRRTHVVSLNAPRTHHPAKTRRPLGLHDSGWAESQEFHGRDSQKRIDEKGRLSINSGVLAVLFLLTCPLKDSCKWKYYDPFLLFMPKECSLEKQPLRI